MHSCKQIPRQQAEREEESCSSRRWELVWRWNGTGFPRNDCFSNDCSVKKKRRKGREIHPSQPATYSFWLLQVCPWHVSLPAKVAGFPETDWSSCLLDFNVSFVVPENEQEGFILWPPGFFLVLLIVSTLKASSLLLLVLLKLDCWCGRPSKT